MNHIQEALAKDASIIDTYHSDNRYDYHHDTLHESSREQKRDYFSTCMDLLGLSWRDFF